MLRLSSEAGFTVLYSLTRHRQAMSVQLVHLSSLEWQLHTAIRATYSQDCLVQ